MRREDIFITSKLFTRDHGADKAYQAGLQSLKNLQVDYIDLYLIHFPGVSGLKSDDPTVKQLRKESWADLEKLKSKILFTFTNSSQRDCISFSDEGKFRSIGVSNYLISHLDDLFTCYSIPPAVNQCEFHPHLVQKDLVDYCKTKGIHFQAYSSLGRLIWMKVVLTGFILKVATIQDREIIVRSSSLNHFYTNWLLFTPAR